MSESYTDKIEAYLSGQMSRDEQLQFESELETNKELASVFNIYRTVETTMGSLEKNKHAKASFKRMIEEANASYRNSKTEQNPNATSNPNPAITIPEKDITPRPENTRATIKKNSGIKTIKIWQKLAVVAAVVGIVAYSAVRISKMQNRKENKFVRAEKPDSSQYKTDIRINIDSTNTAKATLPKGVESNGPPKKYSLPLTYPGKVLNSKRSIHQNALFAENFNPDAVPDDIPPLLQISLDHYKKEEYIKTIASIDAVLQEQERGGEQTDEQELANIYMHYYKAQSYLALNKTDKAIPELKNVINKGSDGLKSSAQWYLALAYLKKGDTKKTKALLNELSQNNKAGRFQTRAENLWQRLQKVR